MQSFETRAIEVLRERGLRVTMPRLQVLRTLATSATPLSAYGVREKIVREGGRIDVVSVYRILGALKDVGLVHHIGVVDGYLACHMGEDHEAESEHLICESCGKVQELAVPAEAVKATQLQLKQVGFRPNNIKVEIVGKCRSCG